jgi:polyhydroxyalkanoate synthesis regulator phasin
VRDELRRAALVTSGVFDLTRQKAEQVVKDLVSGGFVRREQTGDAVKELLHRSEENRRDIVTFIRSELRNQIEGLGLATKRDVERLERRVARLEAASKPKKKSTAKKSSSSSKVSEAGATKTAEGAAEGGSGENRASEGGDD